jgi:hypothetical protein
MSSTEAEYMTLSQSTKEAIHLRRFLSAVLDLPSTTIIFNDIKVEYLPTDQMPADSDCVLTAQSDILSRGIFSKSTMYICAPNTHKIFEVKLFMGGS